MKYITIYDVSNEGMTYHWLIPLCFIVGGLFMWFYTKRYNPPKAFGEYGKLTSNISKKMAPVFYPIFIGLSTLAFIILLISGITKYNSTQDILSSKNFEIIEGKIENYQRWASRNIQIKETFSINNQEFTFDQTDGTYYGYRPNNKKQIIDDGMYLRISYYQEGLKKIVLKIEKGI
jgi:hypothetical protein